MKLILSVIALLYALSPYDLLPDFIPGLGWIDDFILLGLVWYFYYSGSAGRMSSGFFRRTGSAGSGADPENGERADPGNSKRSGTGAGAEDAWTVLGIERGASPEEIKKAYRELAGKYHPDKVAHLGDEFRVLAEERFKKVQAAYEELKGR